jgi:hypothetical protein
MKRAVEERFDLLAKRIAALERPHARLLEGNTTKHGHLEAVRFARLEEDVHALQRVVGEHLEGVRLSSMAKKAKS